MSVIYKILIAAVLLVGSLAIILQIYTNSVSEVKQTSDSIKIGKALLDVDFDESSGFSLLEKHKIKFHQPDNEVKIKFELIRQNYERFKPSKMELSSDPIIPKTIHIIWIGSNILPKNYQYYLETWRKFHPTWQIKVWNEEDILKEDFPSADLYLQAESYAERVDIMRYEILYRYGGLYVDADIECFANFDELNHKYDFFANLEAPIINNATVQVVNSMIGAVPNHPILLKTLERIRREWNSTSAVFLKQFSSYPRKEARSKHHLAVRRTMIPFSDMIFDFLLYEDKSKYKTIILPLGYNMPIYPIKDDHSYKVIMQNETRSVHHYDKENSLMTNPGFTKSLFDFTVILDEDVEVFQSQRHIFLHFQDLFKSNFPTKISFEPVPQTPEVIYLSNSNKTSEKELFVLKEKWQELNPFFIVNIIDDKELLSYLPTKIKLQDHEILKLIARFYFINKNGGVYVDSSFIPADLQEFNYKYKYYGVLNTVLNPQDLLYMDTSFIASKSNHIIISDMLREVEEEVSNFPNITSDKVKDIYMDSAYKYYMLDVKNILFPESIFNQKR